MTIKLIIDAKSSIEAGGITDDTSVVTFEHNLEGKKIMTDLVGYRIGQGGYVCDSYPAEDAPDGLLQLRAGEKADWSHPSSGVTYKIEGGD